MPAYRLTGRKEVIVKGVPTGHFKNYVHRFEAANDEQAVDHAKSHAEQHGVYFLNVQLVTQLIHLSAEVRV